MVGSRNSINFITESAPPSRLFRHNGVSFFEDTGGIEGEISTLLCEKPLAVTQRRLCEDSNNTHIVYAIGNEQNVLILHNPTQEQLAEITSHANTVITADPCLSINCQNRCDVIIGASVLCNGLMQINTLSDAAVAGGMPMKKMKYLSWNSTLLTLSHYRALCEEVSTLCALWTKMSTRLSEMGLHETYELEMCCAPIIHKVAANGVQFDRKHLETILADEGYSNYRSLLGHLDENNRIHCKLNQFGTDSGRIISSEPNLQGLKKGVLRECVIPEEGNVFIIADFSQMELRIAAGLAEDATMIDAINESADLHSLTASAIFGKPLSEITHDERSVGKTLNFSVLYGISPSGLVKKLAEVGVNVSILAAEEYIHRFFQQYSGIKSLFERLKSRYPRRQYGRYVVGRSLGGRLVSTAEEYTPVTKVVNTPIQSTASDIFKEAICLLDARLDPECKIDLLVHDEVIIECPEGIAKESAEIVKKALEEAGRHFVQSVPLQAEVKVCKSWAEK